MAEPVVPAAAADAAAPVGADAPATAAAVVALLRRRGVRVVVWDMDRTMCGAHCGQGLPRHRLFEYVGAVSLDFVALTRLIAATPGMQLAVATGSDPAEYDVAGQSRDTHILGPDLATAVITAHCPEALSAFGIMIGYDATIHEGKDAPHVKTHHLATIRAHYAVEAPSEVVLIDDSGGTLRQAAAEGHATVHVRDTATGFQFADAVVAFQ